MEYNFPHDIHKYKLQKLIGKGSTSEVYDAICLTNDKEISIKKIDLELTPLEIEVLRQEVAFWSSSQHPNIVGYYGSFVSGSILYIIMEIQKAGSIYDIMKFGYPNGFKSEEVIATILHEVLLSLQYIHESGQVHRDIKPGNVLVGSDGSIKLGDFGVAASILEQGRKRARYTIIGTPCYMAPEVLAEVVGYTEKADIWSLGITAIEIATGSAPYSNLPYLEIIKRIINDPPPELPPGQFSQEFQDVVKQCLNHDNNKRPSAAQLLKHPFFAQAKDKQFIISEIISKIPSLADRFSMMHKSPVKRTPAKHSNQTTPQWCFAGIDGLEDKQPSTPLVTSKNTHKSNEKVENQVTPGKTRFVISRQYNEPNGPTDITDDFSHRFKDSSSDDFNTHKRIEMLEKRVQQLTAENLEMRAVMKEMKASLDLIQQKLNQ